MKRCIVNSRFLTQPITGVQRFAIEISRQIKQFFPETEFLAPRGVLDEKLAAELGVQVVGRLTGHAWEQIELPIILKSMGSPLLINLTNTAPLFYPEKISTVHDVAVERFPQSFSRLFRIYYRFLIPQVLNSSKKVCTVSEFSKSEISSFFGVSKDKIFVVHNAASDSFSRPSASTCRQPFILAVSSVTYQKNFKRLIEAFQKIDDRYHCLKIVGNINRSFSKSGFIAAAEENERIIFLGRVSEGELNSLYSQAAAFVYPSLYEGFGIPPLEAQACGCPVVISNAASLPEVYGDSALYFDPYDVDDIARKMDLIVRDDSLRQALSEKGYCNVEKYSWEVSALKFFREVEGLM